MVRSTKPPNQSEATPQPRLATVPKKPPTRAVPSDGRPTKSPLWAVRIFLGDQCDWFIGGIVRARHEEEAIDVARKSIYVAWPLLASHLDFNPALANRAETEKE